MQKVFTILTAVLLTANLFAQSPEKVSYQAVIRDSDNNLVANHSVGMQISILQGSASGTAVYVETQAPVTNTNGLLSIEIGTGTSGDDFTTIDWANGIYFIKTEVDPAGGTNYSLTGISQLLSVPYALHAKTAETVTGGISETDPLYSSWTKDYGDLINTPDIADSILAVIDTTTRFVVTEVDGDATNEIQKLSYSDNVLSIENGNSVSLSQSQWTTTNSNIYYNAGLVGIGIDTDPTAVLELYDNVGYPFFKFVSEDNVYTTWQSDRTGVDDYQIGIDGGNNRFNIANTTTGYYPVTIHGKNTGIGTWDPKAPLHITDFMKLEPRSTAPSSPSKGMIYYDSSDDKLKVYTGSAWENLN